MAFTDDYYREKLQLAVQKCAEAKFPSDKLFYEKIARKWAALLPPGKTLVAENKNEPANTELIESPLDMALRSRETRDGRRLSLKSLIS